MNRLAEVLGRPEAANLVVINEVPANDELDSIVRNADGVEFRADLSQVVEVDYLKAQAKKLQEVPTLLTIRSSTERGGWHSTEAKRLDLYSGMSDLVDGFDVELASGISPFVTDIAHEEGKIAIVSSHDFKKTPSAQELEDMLGHSMEIGADYFKIATRLRTLDDYHRLVKFTLRHSGEGIIVVGMGDEVKAKNDIGEDISPRVALLAIGSAAGYSYAGEGSTAPGQLHYLDMYEAMVQEVPGYNGILQAA